MKTLLEIITLSTQFLEAKGVVKAKRQAEELIADVLGLKRIDLYLQFERPLLEKELTLCRDALQRRGKKEPLQYIKGTTYFLDCLIKVNPNVLIPRQETEILADKIIQRLSSENLENKTFWDICTGSGCIAISVKKKFESLLVEASDISEKALETAKINAELNEVNVSFNLGDLFLPFKGKKADFIVANPPYISEKEYQHLEEEVRLYEPKLALVGGVTGYEYYQALASDLSLFLNPGGKVWLEVGCCQGNSVIEIFKSKGFSKCLVEKDWAGHDRFFFLEREL